MPKILKWTNADEMPLFLLVDDAYQWTPPTVLPNRSDAFQRAVGPFTVNPDWAFYVTPAPLQVEEYPWNKPWVLPDRSDSFQALVQPFTFAPDEHVLVPNSPFGGQEYSDWEYKPPTQLASSLSVQALWSQGSEETPNVLGLEESLWDAMPMRLHRITAPVFTDIDVLPMSITMEDAYAWSYRPPLAPFLKQPFTDEEVWGSTPITVEEMYDALGFLPPKQVKAPMLARFWTVWQDEEVWFTPFVVTGDRRRHAAWMEDELHPNHHGFDS